MGSQRQEVRAGEEGVEGRSQEGSSFSLVLIFTFRTDFPPLSQIAEWLYQHEKRLGDEKKSEGAEAASADRQAKQARREACVASPLRPLLSC